MNETERRRSFRQLPGPKRRHRGGAYRLRRARKDWERLFRIRDFITLDTYARRQVTIARAMVAYDNGGTQ